MTLIICFVSIFANNLQVIILLVNLLLDTLKESYDFVKELLRSTLANENVSSCLEVHFDGEEES